MDYMLRPRDFNDVSIFYREIEDPDDGGTDRGFKLPELDLARQFSINLDNDYLIDPMQSALSTRSHRTSSATRKTDLSAH